MKAITNLITGKTLYLSVFLFLIINIYSLENYNIITKTEMDSIMTHPEKDTTYDESPSELKFGELKWPDINICFKKFSTTILLKVEILSDGNVGLIEVLSVTDDFSYHFIENCILFMKGTTFTPAMKNGKPVTVWIKYPITIELEE